MTAIIQGDIDRLLIFANVATLKTEWAEITPLLLYKNNNTTFVPDMYHLLKYIIFGSVKLLGGIRKAEKKEKVNNC